MSTTAGITFSSVAAGRCTRPRTLPRPCRSTPTGSGAGEWFCRCRWDRTPSRPRGRLLRSGHLRGCPRCRQQGDLVALPCGTGYDVLLPGHPLDLDRLAAAFSPRTRAIIVNTPSNPSGRVLTRAELGAIARALRPARRARRHRRDLRAHPLRRRARPHRHAAGHARAHGHHQRRVQDVQRHRLAHRLDRRARRPDRRDPEGARLPHRGRAGAAAGGRRRGARRAATRRSTTGSTAMYRGKRDLLHAALVDAGFRCLRPGGRVLHPGRLHRARAAAAARSAWTTRRSPSGSAARSA